MVCISLRTSSTRPSSSAPPSSKPQAYLDRDPNSVAGAELGGYRTVLLVPMLTVIWGRQLPKQIVEEGHRVARTAIDKGHGSKERPIRSPRLRGRAASAEFQVRAT